MPRDEVGGRRTAGFIHEVVDGQNLRSGKRLVKFGSWKLMMLEKCQQRIAHALYVGLDSVFREVDVGQPDVGLVVEVRPRHRERLEFPAKLTIRVCKSVCVHTLFAVWFVAKPQGSYKTLTTRSSETFSFVTNQETHAAARWEYPGTDVIPINLRLRSQYTLHRR